MNEVLSSSSFTSLCVENPHLPNIPWLNILRAEQLNTFLKRGFPTKKEELWKYTHVGFLENLKFKWGTEDSYLSSKKFLTNAIKLIFINGYFSYALSDLNELPKDVIVCNLEKSLTLHEGKLQNLIAEYDVQQHPFSALNTALMTDGLFLSVPKNYWLTKPIHCVYINTQDNIIIAPRNIINLEANSKAIIVEEYFSKNARNYFNNTVTQINLAENAALEFHKIQNENNAAIHVANLFVKQKTNSSLHSFQYAKGALLAREDFYVVQEGSNATTHLNGIYHLNNDNQHIDNHLLIEHQVPFGTSLMKYKGILNKKSQAVFNGKVYVHKGANHINAEQANHNLLLSNLCEVNTKPELEIYAEDIKCTHGATVGQLNKDALFYLRSRGISEKAAIDLLTKAFDYEVLNSINNSTVKNYITEQVGLC